MCHYLKLPSSVTENIKILEFNDDKTDEMWVVGGKIIEHRDGDYYSMLEGSKYSWRGLPSGIVIGDTSFKPHIWTLDCGKMLLHKNCPSGLYAYNYVGVGFLPGSSLTVSNYWYVTARYEWLSLISNDLFSAHTLICAESMNKLKQAIDQYRTRVRSILGLSWKFTRSRDKVKSPIFGYGRSRRQAINDAMESLMNLRPLHERERRLAIRSASSGRLKRIFKDDSKPIYAEIYSSLWMPDIACYL